MSRGRQIGRLKLRPLAPEVERKYLLNWRGLDLVRDPAAFPKLTSPGVFENNSPLEVEIGPGSGEYLCHLAGLRPSVNFLGIEVSRRAAYASVLQAAKEDLNNVRILRADFRMLRAMLAPESWQAAYLHFPDPAHRPSDAKRTLFDRDFLDAMAFALTPGGTLSVVSDNTVYFDRMLALAETDKRFKKAHADLFLVFDPEVKSRFQRSWESKGVAARQFVIRKI